MENQKQSIVVKPEYISVSFYRRLISTGAVFLIAFVVFFIISFLITQLSGFLVQPTILAFMSLVLAGLLCPLTYFSETILKKLTLHWNYDKFLALEQASQQLNSIAIVVPLLYVLGNSTLASYSFWGDLSVILVLFSLILMLIFFISSSYSAFYNTLGKVVVGYGEFLIQFQINPNTADFSKLLFASKNISKIARAQNMTVDSYKLCLGLSISCIEKPLETEADIKMLSDWAQEPCNNARFTSFRSIINKYLNLALDSSESGITEKSHWTFETKTTILNVLIVPVVIGLLAIVLPKLFDFF